MVIGVTKDISKDGTCPNCGVVVTSLLHYGFDGYPWTWCQNCHSYVKFEVNKEWVEKAGDINE